MQGSGNLSHNIVTLNSMHIIDCHIQSTMSDQIPSRPHNHPYASVSVRRHKTQNSFDGESSAYRNQKVEAAAHHHYRTVCDAHNVSPLGGEIPYVKRSSIIRVLLFSCYHIQHSVNSINKSLAKVNGDT